MGVYVTAIFANTSGAESIKERLAAKVAAKPFDNSAGGCEEPFGGLGQKSMRNANS